MMVTGDNYVRREGGIGAVFLVGNFQAYGGNIRINAPI